MKLHHTFFNFNRRWRLSLSTVVSDDDYHRIIGKWLSGRLWGRYVSVLIPWRGRL